jgi:hypothetical protein
MPLSEKQLEEMYDASLKCSLNLDSICKQLDKGGEKFEKHEGRLTQIEKEQSFLKGKIGAFILFLTLCATITIQGIGWGLTHLFSNKGVP